MAQQDIQQIQHIQQQQQQQQHMEQVGLIQDLMLCVMNDEQSIKCQCKVI